MLYKLRKYLKKSCRPNSGEHFFSNIFQNLLFKGAFTLIIRLLLDFTGMMKLIMKQEKKQHGNQVLSDIQRQHLLLSK